MPARKSTKQSKQEPVEATEPVATEQVSETDAAVRRLRSKFTRGLRSSRDTYNLVRSIVEHLSTTSGQEFDTMWSQVTDRDDKHFQRHFRKQKREQNPFHDIKSAIPAYSYFTKEHNSKLRAQHPDKKFGEISTMVGELWSKMNEKQKAKYHKMAAEDKKRHQREIEERSRQLEQPAAATTEAEETTATATTSTRSGRKSRK
jgi:hypothetical protein